MTFFVTFTFDLSERHQLSDFLCVAEWMWTKNIPKSHKETDSKVICLPIEYSGWYSGRWPSGCQISKAFYYYLNFILLTLSVTCYADMRSIYWNIITKSTAQSFHFDCKSLVGFYMTMREGFCCLVYILRLSVKEMLLQIMWLHLFLFFTLDNGLNLMKWI